MRVESDDEGKKEGELRGSEVKEGVEWWVWCVYLFVSAFVLNFMYGSESVRERRE